MSTNKDFIARIYNTDNEQVLTVKGNSREWVERRASVYLTRVSASYYTVNDELMPVPMPAFRCTYRSGYISTTTMAAGITTEAARQYFVGNKFDIGCGEQEFLDVCVSVEPV